MVSIKTKEEIALIKESGHITYMCHQHLKDLIAPGVTTKFLDEEAGRFIRSQGGVPSCLNYEGYPGNICVSVNDEVVHGIGSDRELQEGDIVTLFGQDGDYYLPVNQLSELSGTITNETLSCIGSRVERVYHL